MGESLHVLVYGTVDLGSCDFVRLGAYRDLLPDHDVEMRTWEELSDCQLQAPAGYEGRLEDAIRDGVATIDMSPLEWADVLVFRRYYATGYPCNECDYAAPKQANLESHWRATGHVKVARDLIIRGLLGAIEKDRAVLRGRAMIYELDDDLPASQPWLGFYNRIQGDLDLIERLARQADLVTVTTPILAARMRRFNNSVRVVRNAVNPEWYEPEAPEPEPRAPSFLYYGVSDRLRDYAICRDAVDETARATGFPRIWLGSDVAAVRAIVDEARPYVPGVREFARQLVAARPAIGLAPVGQDDFSRAHSELHWLEYSLAGAATVASRTMGGGPYEVIRDGVDGLLARNKAEWRDNLRQLAASPQMREELAGRARERVLTEYDVHQRAAEWADAFRWAAEHAGRGLLRGLTRGLDRAQAQEMESRMESEARANLAHRRVARTRSIEERETLARLRGDRDVCWPEEDGFDRNPLVTVRIATYNRGRLIVERSIKSALAQTYRNIEILVVGDCATPETVEAVSSVKDSRLRFVNLPERGRYPAEPENRWMVAGSVPMNYARGVARGAWIAPLDDDDEITPDHVKLLVGLATEHRLEFMYGLAEAELPDGSWSLVGAWPPVQGGICHGSIVYSSKLDCFGYDEESYRQNEPADWNRWRRMIDAGVRMGRVEQVVYRHYAEARHRDQAQREPSQSPIALLEARS